MKYLGRTCRAVTVVSLGNIFKMDERTTEPDWIIRREKQQQPHKAERCVYQSEHIIPQKFVYAQ